MQVFLCPLAWLAIWQVYRWAELNHDIFRFHHGKPEWYSIFIFSSWRSPKVQYSYEQHNKHAGEVLSSAGVERCAAI